jgi:hypothetical protein
MSFINNNVSVIQYMVLLYGNQMVKKCVRLKTSQLFIEHILTIFIEESKFCKSHNKIYITELILRVLRY